MRLLSTGKASHPELELSRARQGGKHRNPDTSGMQKSNRVLGCEVKSFSLCLP